MQITTMSEQVDFAHRLLAAMKKKNAAERDLYLMNCIINTLEIRLDVENRRDK
jgi:hypothetical protein